MRVRDAGDFIQVEIEDNGKGIADHVSCSISLTGFTGRMHPGIPHRAEAASGCRL